ncbi:MAG: MFS transporter [Stenotrophomonas sp.]
MKRYYPWLMAIMGLLVLLVSNGLIITGLTAFDESLLKAFGWTRSELKMRDLITLVLAGWLGPFIGVIIDRAGPRKLILAGIALLACMYFAYANVQSLIQLYLIHVGFGVVLVAAGLNVSVIYVSQWFAVNRGTAIGIALVGTSMGGMVFPALGVHLMQTMDWRTAFMWEMAIPLTFLVIAYFFVRSPQPGGIKPWGTEKVAAKAASDAAANIVSLPDLTYKQALRTRTFWSLATVAMATFFSIMAVSQNLFLHMRDLQFSPVQAGNSLALMFGLAMVGKFFFGMLADVLPPKAVFLVNLAIMATGAFILATMRADLIWYSLILFGLGWGGLYTMVQLLAVNSFGLSSAGKILGSVTLLDATTAGLGIWLTAKIFDLTGSYKPAFQLVFGLIVLALLMATLVRDERARLAKIAS